MRIDLFHRAWLDMPQPDRESLAKACGTSVHYLRNLVYGQYLIPIPMAVVIERHTGISRRELRPTDWGDIWPELIDAEHPWPPVAELTQESA